MLVLLLLTSGVAGAAVATPALAQTAPTPDPLAEADATIARLRAEADAQSAQYFEALAGLADVQRRIDDIEARIPALAAQVGELRTLTRTRAVEAYKRSGHDLGSVIGADDPLSAARRAQFLGRLNARDNATAADLRTTSTKLAAQRADLRTAKDAADAALDQVKQQGQAIDALLVDAQERRRIAATPPTTAPPPAATGVETTAPREPSTTATTAPKTAPPTAPPTYTPTPGTHPSHNEPFLACTRTREASGNYAAYNPAGPYMGAYQMLQTTWNSAANHAGRTDLIGVPPHTASPYDQDDVAWTLYTWQGSRPWGGLCDPPE
ncbi:MAG: hypothetical protein WDA60_09035 [Acidimicrobiia bacterium]